MRYLLAALTAVVLLAPDLASAGDYAPMDCAKAKSAAELTICKNYALGQAEARMATLYGIATSLVAMQRGDMQAHSAIGCRRARIAATVSPASPPPTPCASRISTRPSPR